VTLASSFDKLRMRSSDFNGLNLMVSLSNPHGELVEPWAASFFSSLLALQRLISYFPQEENSMLRPIKLPDAIRFFEAKGVSRKCPSCGHDECDVIDEDRADVHLALPGFTYGGYDFDRATMFGVYGLTCTDCGYMRLYRRSVIVQWIETNPPASAE